MFGFRKSLIEQGKSCETAESYGRSAEMLLKFYGGRIDVKSLYEFKEYIQEKYALRSVNAIIAGVNKYLEFLGKNDLKLTAVRVQKRSFAESDRELSRNEYERLLEAAKRDGKERLYCLLQTICATGIRVSEVKYITLEAVRIGMAAIELKGKRREILLPKKLCRMLLDYAKKHGIKNGCVFVTSGGRALDRSNIWKEMKALCKKANVSPKKVFPHNLRHLFARTFYKMEKDIVRLADILGHSSIDTTRIYTMESCETYRRRIERLGLLLC